MVDGYQHQKWVPFLLTQAYVQSHSRHLNDTIVAINWNETINNTAVK